ncbi:TIGR02588 family protein [Oscillatoria sp. FACHB-1407]|uniref:TIGR02588 family protein n=1 Tax=Oscillatoria sp. FACHB-1407 TaxID=2692847 RepID=UPI001687ABAD|nr:TIGR02588 family protein [Oscillatoria sp. FACHB-1407]MBD2462777.1 TIGR02588 family protein [Oscillatoria sp. FACHB-1407]
MSQTQSPKTSSQATEQEQPSRTPAEWVTFGIASCILAGIVGLVLYVWFGTNYQDDPQISIRESGEVREAEGNYYLPFEVSNTGGSTAESVQIMAELEVNGEVTESAEQQIDFLSGGETEEGAFVFSEDPQQGELTLRVASYKLP